jgi:hypothetical protein
MKQSAIPVAFVAAFAIACGARGTSAPEVPTSSTTQVSAGQMSTNQEAPHVAEAHAHVDPAGAPLTSPKDQPRRHADRKPGGGFTGYK